MQLNEQTSELSSIMMAAAGVGSAPSVYTGKDTRSRVGPTKADRPTRPSIAEVQQQIAAMPVTTSGLMWRLFEIVFAAAALLLSLPILCVIGLIIRFDSRGPVLFRQSRVGKSGKLFPFTKFRTMYADAKQRFPHLYAYKYSDEQIQELKFKVPNDPRATPAGRWLRQSTLDELPNFWHVLTGEMALVGPRPEIPEMLPYYNGEELLKFTVRPGITGLAQVSGRGLLSFRDTVDLDVEYVRNRTAWGDLKIIALTIHRIVWRHGAF